jgi:hypothetical protein
VFDAKAHRTAPEGGRAPRFQLNCSVLAEEFFRRLPREGGLIRPAQSSILLPLK